MTLPCSDPVCKARTGPGSLAGIPFIWDRSPFVKAQVGGLRPSPYGPPTAGLVPPMWSLPRYLPGVLTVCGQGVPVP